MIAHLHSAATQGGRGEGGACRGRHQMLLHLEPSQLRREGGRSGGGNPRQRRQGQLLNHNYNKVSARHIRTCGSPTQSGLINLQKPRFFFVFFPLLPAAVVSLPFKQMCHQPVGVGTRGEGELLRGRRIHCPAKNKKKNAPV